MVASISNLSRNGLNDWVLQRLSAIILAAYTVFLVGFVVLTPEINFDVWSQLFARQWVRIFTLIALLSIVVHGWVGLWTIITDYLNDRALGSCSIWIRLPVLLLCIATLVGYLIWGVYILWEL